MKAKYKTRRIYHLGKRCGVKVRSKVTGKKYYVPASRRSAKMRRQQAACKKNKAKPTWKNLQPLL